MNFQQVQKQHLNLQKEYHLGNLTADSYQKKTNALQTQTKDGIRWRIGENGSGWEKQVGNEWIKARPDYQAEVMEDDFYQFPDEPSSTGRFFKQFIVKSLQAVDKRWLPIVIIFAVALLFGLYLNFGDRFGAWRLYEFMTAVFGDKSQALAKIVLAFTLTFMIIKLVISIKTKKLQNTIKGFTALPKKLSAAFAANVMSALSVLLVSAAFGLLITFWLSGIMLSLLLTVGLLTIASDQDNSSMFLLTALIISDIKKTTNQTSSIRANPISMMFTGLALGSFISIFMYYLPPFLTYSFFGMWIAAAIVLTILGHTKKVV